MTPNGRNDAFVLFMRLSGTYSGSSVQSFRCATSGSRAPDRVTFLSGYDPVPPDFLLKSIASEKIEKVTIP